MAFSQTAANRPPRLTDLQVCRHTGVRTHVTSSVQERQLIQSAHGCELVCSCSWEGGGQSHPKCHLWAAYSDAVAVFTGLTNLEYDCIILLILVGSHFALCTGSSELRSAAACGVAIQETARCGKTYID